jgi:hypothetical protein
MRAHAYLIYGLTFLVPWIAVWIRRRDLRVELLVSSLVTAPLGPIFERWYHLDYWKPRVLGPFAVGLEDFLFGFGVGGLGAVAYEVLAGRVRVPRYGWQNPLLFVAIFLFGLAAHAIAVPAVNSIHVSMGVFLIATAIMVVRRRDLVPVAIVSGAAIAAFMILSYQVVLIFRPTLFEDFWFLSNLSGRFILRVPIEEPLWGFLWGAFIGCAWKYGFGEICAPRRAPEGAAGETARAA